MRGFPKIKLGIKFTTETFNIEQRFLQQDQLRLNFHIEPSRGFKQAHHDLSK